MYSDIAFSALRSLASNRLRSSLSVLGIIIGTFAIVFVNAISSGVDAFIGNQLSFLSATSIFVEPSSSSFSRSRLEEEDLERVLEKAAFLSGGTVFSIGKANMGIPWESEAYMVLWTDEYFSLTMGFGVGAGRFLNKSETKSAEKVVVIGQGIATRFFSWKDALGEFLSIGKSRFRVIGILSDAPSLSGMSFNDMAYIPFTSSKRFVIGSGNNMIALAFVAKDTASVPNASAEIRTILRKAHGLSEKEPDDFNVYEQKAMMNAIDLITRALTFLLTGVAALILAVSGIGIMNVMYASVAERTKDIGILRAIGARKRDVASKFLAESVFLSAFGAAVGIALAEASIVLVNQFSPDFVLVRGMVGDAIALGFTLVVAVFFGMYPAIRASNLDPVDALK